MRGPIASVFTVIFNLSLIESVIPTCFKQTTIEPVPKEAKVTCLNDYSSVALTSVAMKCLERLDYFASTDWNMLRESSNSIEEYTTSVIGFINKCIDDVIPTVTVRTYPNQKPWITGNIRVELKARAAAFKEQEINSVAYKKSRYALRRTIKQAKHQYRIMDNKGKSRYELPSDASPPDEVNAFYARFEASNTEACTRAPAVLDDSLITLSVANVNKTFKQVNIHKAAGPDGLPGHVLKACVDQLQVSSLSFSTSP